MGIALTLAGLVTFQLKASWGDWIINRKHRMSSYKDLNIRIVQWGNYASIWVHVQINVQFYRKKDELNYVSMLVNPDLDAKESYPIHPGPMYYWLLSATHIYLSSMTFFGTRREAVRFEVKYIVEDNEPYIIGWRNSDITAISMKELGNPYAKESDLWMSFSFVKRYTFYSYIVLLCVMHLPRHIILLKVLESYRSVWRLGYRGCDVSASGPFHRWVAKNTIFCFWPPIVGDRLRRSSVYLPATMAWFGVKLEAKVIETNINVSFKTVPKAVQGSAQTE